MKILVVEDNRTTLRLYESMLRPSLPDDDVTFVENGNDALELVQNEDFDLVLTDLEIPGIKGTDLIQSVRSFCPKTEVIVITGHASLESAVESLRVGARDYLEKPVNFPLLLQKIAIVRYHRSLHDSLSHVQLENQDLQLEFQQTIQQLESENSLLKNRIDSTLRILKDKGDKLGRDDVDSLIAFLEAPAGEENPS